ncbi:two component AraC family transcriptional regulator [Paenibacillus sp. FSL R7-269]|uniref:helix-turn-helix domain-containing protein n=1 Tax=Paenibacillus sp. FSL R7-269 TaxID=1226755 RepID=UPI0003E283B1|nr:helix-turn-helix domain-containing protein [Paenibacillus sp. FSL R7-269]ETT33648.1 two component AraC family transcriptional regulator [Paenibacillus sp. FSL R7-269]
MKALIVDDEARVRKAVRLLVDWDAHQIEEILEAGNGNEAIGLIRQEKPALVIMDMMMESGSGLELMTWVDEFAGSTKFIVVSGHNDFDFVRQTVRHGGIDYILKPIEPDMINSAVSKAVTAWRAEEAERSHRQHQSLRLNEIKPIFGEKLLSALIDDRVNAEASLRRLIHDGIIPPDSKISRLLLVQTDSGNNPLLRRFGGDSELLYYAIVNICNEFLQQGTGIAFRYWGGPPEIAILLWEPHESVTSLISRMNQGIFLTLQFRMHFGISTPGAFPAHLPAGRAEAAEALLRRNLLRHEDYCHFAGAESSRDAGALSGGVTGTGTDAGPGAMLGGKQRDKRENAVPLSFADVQEDWRMAVISGTPEALSAAAQHWTQELSRRGVVTPQMLNDWKADALLMRSRLVREALGSQAANVLAELEQGDQQYPSPQPSGYSFSLFAWRDWSLAFMQQLSRALTDRQQKERNPMTEIVKYIEQNYPSDLSLQEVAGKFQVSREYVSRRFKQEYGINFSDYIVSVRIEKAKLLMQNPGLKLAQISEMVGFHDVKYFSKVFKKHTGHSPKDYRDQAEH